MATSTIEICHSWLLKREMFFVDRMEVDRNQSTSAEAAEEARRFIEDFGIHRFLTEWELDGLDIFVDGIQVAAAGRALVGG